MILRAKAYRRLWLATHWMFPGFLKQRNDMLKCITQAIANYKADGGVIDEGEDHLFILVLLLTEY